MLSHLAVKNIVLIDALELAFGPSFTVLTGETGAGKSILLDALALALGAKADGKLVRSGCDEGSVIATFEAPPSHPAWSALAEAGWGADDAIIVRRQLQRDGRAKAFVNDQPASLSLLRTLGASLVEVHGQHADRTLASAAAQRGLVDAYGGLVGEVERVRTLWATLKDAERELAALEAKMAAAREEADFLRAAVAELTDLDPEPGEEEHLSAGRQAMAAAERVAGDLNEAAGSLEGPKSPIPSLAGVLRKLERKRDGAEEQLNPVMDAIANALDVLEDVRSTIADAQRSLDYDPGAMETVEERLFSLRAAARKYKTTIDALPDLAVRMADELSEIDASEDRLGTLAATVAAAERAYSDAARSLSQHRCAAADALAAAVMAELAPLKLEKAVFSVRHDPTTPGPDGIDQLAFWVQTNPGSPPGPITKVASGGEFSRFLLALKVCLADRGSASTLIFDEIDTGVGGAVSQAIGQRMARLAATVQVLSITHAPQVAALADGHLLIAKGSVGTTTSTDVRTIVGENRREEIARMLAGAVITDEARAAADRLIDA